jgi:hypothetical protein
MLSYSPFLVLVTMLDNLIIGNAIYVAAAMENITNNSVDDLITTAKRPRDGVD